MHPHALLFLFRSARSASLRSAPRLVKPHPSGADTCTRRVHVFKRMHPKGASSWLGLFFFSGRSLRFAPRLVNRTFGADMHPSGASYNMCTFGAHVYTRAWRTLRSHDFDTITCVSRCERAVMISCTLRVHTHVYALSASHVRLHACVRTLRFACAAAYLCARVCTLSGTHMCERVHVQGGAHMHTCAHVRTPQVCSHHLRWVRFAPKNPHFVVERFARASRIPACRPSRKIAARGCQRSWVCEV